MEKLKNDDLKSQLWQSARAQSEVCEMYQRDEEELKGGMNYALYRVKKRRCKTS